MAVFFAVISVLLEVFIPYKTYSAVLKWLTLSLFAYVGTVFATHIPWMEALRRTLLPTLLFDRESMAPNGVTAAPVMCSMMLMASDRKIIGKLHLPAYLKVVGWAATGIMVLAAISMFLTSGK
jgi:Mn2+/Fe2+ NRAMP family transporter